jgi:hypothetical protein
MKILEAPWWVLRPDLRAREMDDLRARGIRLVDEGLCGNQLILKLDVPIEGMEDLRVNAVYPQLYPYFRPQVQPDDLSFTVKRHQHPFGKHFCLLANSETWDPNYTLAWFLQAQLPQVLKFRAGDAAQLKHIEEPVGESVANYYKYQEGACVFIDSAWNLDTAVSEGKLRVAYSEGAPLRGAIREIYNSGQTLLATAPDQLAALFPKQTWARWVRIEAAIAEQDPAAMLELLDKRFPELARHQSKKAAWPLITGVVFRDELQQGIYGDNWIFILRGSKPRFIRAARAGESDFASRVPELVPVRTKRITTVGLGSLGMPSAMEFARAGVQDLVTVDFDFVDAGSTVRWPIGLSVAGMQKAAALKDFVARNYPYTTVRCIESQIGYTFNNPETGDEIVVPEIFKTNLLYDATAEREVNYALSTIAAERGVPYICLSTTPGGWGGLVFRQRVGSDRACWSCLQHYLTDETIDTPHSKPGGTLQPAGCVTATFTGAGFDGGIIALMGVRLAISTLCGGAEGGYPNVDWDCAVVQLRDEAGSVLAPAWRPYIVGKHPNCHGPAHESHAMDAAPSPRPDVVSSEYKVPA